MLCLRCNDTGLISEEDDPFDTALPAGNGQLICPQCHEKNMYKTTLKVGQQYRLLLPDSWINYSPGWHLAIVTLVEMFVNPCLDPRGPLSVCDCEGCYVGPYIAWVTSPGLTSSFDGNIFRAKPEWLQTVNRIPCDCPLNLVLSQGCHNRNHI